MKAQYQKIAKKLFVLLMIGTVGLAGCKKFLDVNENPNNPDTASPTLLLPTVQAAVGQLVGNQFQLYGNIWAQYWTQNPTSSQYRAYEQYNVTNTNFDWPWLILYRNALQNAQLIINSNTPNNEHLKGMAYIMKAYTYQLATDGFGDVPLTEALKGNEAGNPHYDPQQLVYDSIYNYIDLGLAAFDATNATSPGEQDLLFGGDIELWRAFANTLKLRAYLRLSQVDPAKAQAGIAALYATNPVFLTQDASIAYTTTGGNDNPLYNEMVALNRTQNIVASGTAVQQFNRNNDPRLFEFYEPNISVETGAPEDTIAYIPQGTYRANTLKRVSPPSALVGGRATDPLSATAPVKLISAAESYFLQAEAVNRGWATAGDVTSLFNQGITASFAATGIPGEAAAYIASAPDAQLTGTPAEQLRLIITQKYYAMCGFQGFEAWTEWRRTGYPNFLVVSAASIIGEGRLPLRFLYPSSEVNTNLNFPGSVPVYEPVWWDK
ncbi:SusD/RagB family nutrient-binding outer membrane lipoprotein [Pedobacter immunditicola]|uniref:SusD/RagB family nutrient-binding outer membrane lipoprotein n=1 Tax=Pedobacter immunditicola TaxID=3133440 RepID=UPI0030A7440C